MAGETLNHPQLGEIHGKKGDGVVQFLGLKYATLKDRFAPPELVTSYNGPVDATRFGYVMSFSSFIISIKC